VIRSYLSGLASNYLNQLLSVLINLLLIPYLLHRLGPQLTGVYLVLTTVANFVAVGIGWLAGAGTRTIATLSATSDRHTVDRVHRLVVLGFAVYSTLILAIMICASLLAGNLWLRGSSMEIVDQARYACLLLGAYVWISYVHNADLALLTALLRQTEANLYRVAAQALFGLAAIALLIHNPRIDVLLAAQVVATLIVAAAVRAGLRFRNIIGPWEWSLPDRALIRQVLVTTGGSYFLFGLAQFALMYADVFVVAAVLGGEAVTAYVVVWRIAEFAGVLLSRISETLSPYLTRIEAHGSVSELRGVFLATSRVQHWLAIAAGCFYALFGPSLVGMWVGVENRPTMWWLYALCGAALIFQVVNRHDVILHFAMGRVGRLVVPHVLEVSAKIGLAVALFPALGIGAPPAAFVAVQVLGMTWWYRRAALQLLNVPWPPWWREVGYPASAELGLLVIWMLAVGQWSMMWSWGEMIVSSVLLMGLLWLVVRWHMRREPAASFTSVAGLLSKY
jgi:O-antigen/teichoic acid export membrane protein